MQWQELRSHLRHLSEADLKRVQDAFLLGQRAHEGQLRKSGEPYFTHPVAIAHMLADMGGDADAIIAALLHDTVEDTDVSLAQIRMEFGETVGNLIDGLTKMERSDMGDSPSLDEQIETLRKMFTLMQQDVRIMVIKLVDRLHNMQTVEFLSPEKQRALAQETLDVYVKIADRLSMQDLRDELESLCMEVLNPAELEALEELKMENERRGRKVIGVMQRHLSTLNATLAASATLHHEHKSLAELRKQQLRGESPATGLPDVIVALTCPDADTCYRILGLLHTRWQREVLSFQDFINSPLQNGYEALHTTVILDDGTRVRCKIRTEDMHVYARKGVARRCFDAAEKGLLDYLPWAKQISTVTEDTANRSEEFWQSLQNDILSEAIMVHGTDDRSLLIPKDSTALDAALQLYGDTALRTRDILINGAHVPFSAQLSHADTVKISLAPKPQMTLAWLRQIHTRPAMALVRKGLSERPKGEKITAGQQLLGAYFREHRRGFLEEFDASVLEGLLRHNGFGSLEQTYIALAEGKHTAEEVEQGVFPKAQREGQTRYSVAMSFPQRLQGEVMEELEQYGPQRVVLDHERDGVVGCRVTLRLSAKQLASLRQRLEGLIESAIHVRPTVAPLVSAAVCLALFVLWGFDPVVARLLLTETGLTAIDLHIIRLATLAAMSGSFLLYARVAHNVRPSRLSLRSRNLWLSAVLLFCVSISTYLSLKGTLPSHYTIFMTAAGIVASGVSRYASLTTRAVTWLLYGSGIIVLLVHNPEWDTLSVLFTVAAICSFTAFTLLSERYKQREHVAARTIQYFFLLATSALLLSLPLLPFTSFSDLSWQAIGAAVLFSVFLSGLPYVVYFTSQATYATAARFSFSIVPFTLLGQAMLIEPVGAITLLSACLVAVGAGVPIATRDQGESGLSR